MKYRNIIFQLNYKFKGDVKSMRIYLVDYKGNEMLNVKVDVNDYMFIVAPEITNENFEYMKPRLMKIRGEFMEEFIIKHGLDEGYNNKIMDEMRKELEKEIKNIHKKEGIMFYIK